MAVKKILWHGEDFVEKIENVFAKLAGVVIVALLVYAYLA